MCTYSWKGWEMLDERDRKILDALQHDAAIQVSQLAEWLRFRPRPARAASTARKAGYIARRVVILDETRSACRPPSRAGEDSHQFEDWTEAFRRAITTFRRASKRIG